MTDAATFDLRGVAGFKSAEVAEPGVVDEDVGGEAALAEFRDQAGDTILRRKVGGNGFNLIGRMDRENAGLDVLEAIGAAGGQDEMRCPHRGELQGKFFAESGGGAGDQRSFSGEGMDHALEAV